MFRGQSSNFRGRGRDRNTRQRNQQRGLFAEGVWHCDCTPRLPAEHFKVKKDGKNHGRWFYTCQQQPDPKKCGFFLWDEDAKPREESAVLHGRKTEPDVQKGWNAGRERVEEASSLPRGKGLFESVERPGKSGDESTEGESPPRIHSTESRAMNGSKRSAQHAQLDDEEFDSWSLDGEDEERLASVADNATLTTPHKAQKTGVYATPATSVKRKLPWLEQAPGTPPFRPAEDYFHTPSKNPIDASQTQSTLTEPGSPVPPPTLATASTPSPQTRHRDAFVNPADDESSLTSEVLGSLSTISVPPATLSSIRGILTKHDLKNQGVKKGRDISRLALKAKDAKIAELQARIASLEADRELERGLGRMREKGG